LLLAGFDRADIDVVAEGAPPGHQLGGITVPAVELADVPEAPRQPFVAPEDTAAIFALSVSVPGCFGALFGALSALASNGSTARIAYCTVLGAVIGCALGYLFARLRGWRWKQASGAPAGTDGFVLWVQVHTPEREEKASRILQLHNAKAVRAHEIERHVEDIPLGTVRPDPWLGGERLGEP
jgi:hypothetical protein